jgi:hypothetical protein
MTNASTRAHVCICPCICARTRVFRFASKSSIFLSPEVVCMCVRGYGCAQMVGDTLVDLKVIDKTPPSQILIASL